MRPSDRARFASLLTDAMAFYRRDVSEFALDVWWQACEGFDLEQVGKAITAHALDPELGRFPPMPADIVKQLQGTRTDRALIAWGKVYGAMKDVGGWSSVAFDDPVIHATLEDLGGWPRLCASKIVDLPHEQRRFCDTYRAYATKPVPYPAILDGMHAASGAKVTPVLIGDKARAKAIAEGGRLMVAA